MHRNCIYEYKHKTKDIFLQVNKNEDIPRTSEASEQPLVEGFLKFTFMFFNF